ncbi:DNA-deoxyinosine glycosylase [Rhodocyclaceae bacterium]
MRLRGKAEVLILGSFPSAASLAVQQYYAHKQNHFWKILGAILKQPLAEMDYAARVRVVQRAGIAIWDVYAACERQGSLDSAIRRGSPNDLSALVRRHAIRRVCFNGQTPGKFAPSLAALGVETRILPSTSPANATWNFERKLAAWREGLSV